MDDLRARDKARLTHAFTIGLDRMLMYFPESKGPFFDATRAKDILNLEHARVRKLMTKLTIVLDRLLVNHALSRTELRLLQQQWSLLNVMGNTYTFVFHRNNNSINTKRKYPFHAVPPTYERKTLDVLETVVLDHANFKSRLKRALDLPSV